ncbi:MAG TPA: c-type cytochrome biogenesis protein CcsB [Verrucomicrobiae bacterium]|nr:c-type cytochrome biogenesis protein CcsB [Verrucomicrobiae bacterium]
MTQAFFYLTLCLYLAATLSYLGYLLRPAPSLGDWGRRIITAGFLAHCATVATRFAAAGHTPITNLHEALSFFSLATVGVFLALQRKYRVPVLGSFVTPVALVLLLVSVSFSQAIGTLNPALKSRWLLVHTTFAFSGYAAFAVAFGAAFMYLLQERFLKKKKFGEMYRRLPSLEMLDEINYKCLTFGFPLLTFAIITGAIWAESAWGTYWSWDPKETWSLITWFVYAALLHGRLTTGWRGKKAAYLAIVGFVILLFTFLGVNLLLPGLHAYN